MTDTIAIELPQEAIDYIRAQTGANDEQLAELIEEYWRIAHHQAHDTTLRRHLTADELQWLITELKLLLADLGSLNLTQKMLLAKVKGNGKLQQIVNSLLITDQTTGHEKFTEFLELLENELANGQRQTTSDGIKVVESDAVQQKTEEIKQDASNGVFHLDQDDEAPVTGVTSSPSDGLDLLDTSKSVAEVVSGLNALLNHTGDIDSIKLMKTIRQVTFQQLLNKVLTNEESIIQEITDELDKYQGLTRSVIEELLEFYYSAKKYQSPQCVIPGFDNKKFTPNLLQCMEVIHIRDNKSRLNLSEPGLGKTDSALLGAVVSGVQRLLVFCPVAVMPGWEEKVKDRYPHFKSIINSQADLRWDWTAPIPDDEPIIAIINWDKLVSDDHPAYHHMIQWLNQFTPDMVVGDEIQYCKERTEQNDEVSARRKCFNRVISQVRSLNDECKLYHLTGSPCPNEFSEAIGCLKSASNTGYEFLDTKKTLMNGLDIFVEVSQIATRVLNLPKNFTVTERNITIPADEIFEDVRKAGKSWAKQTSLTLPYKFQYLARLLKDPSPIVIFTHFVDDVVSEIEQFLIDEGYGNEYSVHTGTLTGGVEEFRISPKKRILIGSIGSMGCGVDGIQNKASRVVYLGYPWTMEDKKQADGRCSRFGQNNDVTIYNLICDSTAEVDGEKRTISFDRFILNKHKIKKTLSDLCIDGVIPAHIQHNFTNTDLNSATEEWQDHLNNGMGMTRVLVEETFIPDPVFKVPSTMVPQASFSDLSREHARCRSSNSSTNYQRYQDDPDSWLDYHTKLSLVREDWHPDPVEVIANKVRSMGSGLRVIDFGCGREMLRHELGDDYEVVGMDYVPFSNQVIQCDLASDAPLVEPGDVGVAINSLMSRDWQKMIANFKQLLKGTGQLFIVQPHAQIKPELIEDELKENGFCVIHTWRTESFTYIRSIID